MTGQEFVQLIRYKTRTDSTTLTDAEIVLLGNSRLETMSRGIMRADEDTLVLPHTTNLIADTREYPFPNALLSRIKYVEAKLDGTNWVYITEFDLHNYQKPTSETDIVANFSNEEGRAFYDIDRKSLWLYSGTVASVTGGLKLWCNTYPAKLTIDKFSDSETDLSEDPSTTTHGFPRELHELWVRGICIDYKENQEKPIPLNQTEMAWKIDYEEAIRDLKYGDMSREVIAPLPSAKSRWNNGQDL